MKAFFSKKGLTKIRETEASGGGGSAVTNWTPGVTPGTNFVFTRRVGTAGELSNYNHTYTLSDPFDQNLGGGFIVQPNVYASPNTGNLHYPFHFQLGNPTGVTGACYVGLIDHIGENPPTVFLAAVINTSGVGAGLTVAAIGNMQTADFTTGSLASLTWQPNSQFIISYDPTAGTYGTVHLFYSGSGTPNVPVVSHILTEAITVDPNSAGAQLNAGSSTWSITILNTPLFEVTPSNPFTITSGGQYDPSTAPTAPAGKSYQINNIVGTIVIPGYGDANEGDIVSYNLDGEIEGRVWEPDEIIAMIPVVKNGMFGLTPYQPTPQQSPNESKLDVSALPTPRANNTYQIVGLLFPLIWENPSQDVVSITIYNGDIIGFNSDSDLVMHFSRSNLT